MAKYDPLCHYLARQKSGTVSLTFTEIERLIGGMLPKSALRDDWWADLAEPDPKHVQKRAWRAAGYTAVRVPGQDRARFDRVSTR
ncbi:DUF7662 domain-containing protein [Brevundimonas variabilis]|uniref:DUF7662 domain-containing protein n=1 Tax=Brevundimonas variabilis TaxID=74312 RepID=A0A7W9FFN3_9CAUL|nr:hypothetical protein [Brevundimonas variabilis]MBB5745723.1 hypothetical protein [Brevundimonas variabilis]